MSAVAIQLLILALLLLAVPAIVGSLCIHAGEWGGKLIFQWISGHFLLWAGFQVICVPMVLGSAASRDWRSCIPDIWQS